MGARAESPADPIFDPARLRANAPLRFSFGAETCFGGGLSDTRAETRARSSLRPPSACTGRTGGSAPAPGQAALLPSRDSARAEYDRA
jgi:hypothetical protein